MACDNHMTCVMSLCVYRHSNFGGAYLVANQFTVSGNSQVYHRPLAGWTEHALDSGREILNAK